MIEINDLTFGYSRNKILFENLNLSLKPGHIYGLLGKNGAGKSTLIKNITGLAFPLNGYCHLNSLLSAKRSPDFLEHFFLIPEDIYLPAVSVNKFVQNTAGFYRRFSKEEFLHHLNEFELDQSMKIESLSFGQQKKVMIAFALATNTDVLIMDEPSNGLDIPSKMQFRKIVSSALTDERCVLISTHQVKDLDNLIDSLVVLNNRHIVLNASVDEISEKLYFSTMSSLDDPQILYSETTVKGHSTIRLNSSSKSSKVDLELLFNALITENSKITTEFKKAI